VGWSVAQQKQEKEEIPVDTAKKIKENPWTPALRGRKSNADFQTQSVGFLRISGERSPTQNPSGFWHRKNWGGSHP